MGGIQDRLELNQLWTGYGGDGASWQRWTTTGDDGEGATIVPWQLAGRLEQEVT